VNDLLPRRFSLLGLPHCSSQRPLLRSEGEYMRPSECPVRAMIDVVDGKWKPMIINYLKPGALRFGQLRRKIPYATKKVLTEQLRELEASKFIWRKV
jgi:DNA-binding HxlR family transcriptional regulator